MNCPLCGSRVVYEGVVSLECVGAGCANASKNVVQRAAVGSFEWARDMWLLGYVLQEQYLSGRWVGDLRDIPGKESTQVPNVDNNAKWRIHPDAPNPVVSGRHAPEGWSI